MSMGQFLWMVIDGTKDGHTESRGGGGHSGTEWGRTFVTYFAEEGVFFLRPPHVRDFVKEGYFYVWGSKSPYNPRNIRGSDAE